MAEPTHSPLSHPNDMPSESFIVHSDSMTADSMTADSMTADLNAEPPLPHADTSPQDKKSLLEALDVAHAALARSQEENEDLKEKLTASDRQIQDQSDQIAMLRGKVEEARRGVMRLQTENRRASQLQAAVNSQDLRTAKRASFILPPTPASPGGMSAGKHIHRRISSMSDPGLHNELRLIASPPSFVTSFPESISGHITPAGPSAEEIAKIRAELAACQQALQEATDAREASETAVRALREFIAENAVGEAKSTSGSEGLQGLRLPPLPTDADVDDAEASAPRKPEEPKRGWGGWLKRETSNSSAKSVPAPGPALSIKSVDDNEPVPATTPTSTPLTNFVSSWTRSRSSSSSVDAAPSIAGPESAPAPAPAPAQATGFRKFFGMGNAPAAPATPQSSTPPSLLETQYESEPEEPKHVPSPLQLHREGSVRDSMSSATVSDAPEPISPPADMVDILLDRGRLGEKDEFTGERTPTVGNATGFAM